MKDMLSFWFLFFFLQVLYQDAPLLFNIKKKSRRKIAMSCITRFAEGFFKIFILKCVNIFYSNLFI